VLPPNGATIVNNTFSGPSYALINLESDVVFKNNILVNTSDYVVNIDSVGSGDTFAYNDYYNVDNGWSHNDTADGTTLAAWTSGSTSLCPGGCDATGSITANPSLISTFILQLGSAVIGAGTNLSSIGIAGLSQGAPQTFGANYACGTGCLSRPSSGAWDMGAYPYSSSSIGAKPSSPTNLTGTVVVN
jgi:hypothetical protein